MVGQKKDIKNRQLTSELARDLAGCRLDGSTIVFDEDVEEGVVVGDPVGGKVQANNMAGENYDEVDGVDNANAFVEACRNIKGYEWNQDDIEFYFNQI